MGQLRYRKTQKPFAPGQDLFEDFGDKLTVLNQDPQQAQVDDVAISGTIADNSTYKIEIEQVEISFDTDSNATIDELGNGLADAINNEGLVNGKVDATYDSNSSTLTITAKAENNFYQFNYHELQDPNGNLSRSNVTAGQKADPVPWGRAIEEHGALGDKLGRLAKASNMTARDLQLTLDGHSAGTFTVILEVDGQTVTAQSTAGNVDDVLNDLQSDLDSNDLLDVSVNTTPNPSELHITPETAGFGDFKVTGLSAADGQEFTLTVDAAGDDFNDVFGGISLVGGEQYIDPGKDIGEYPANTEIDVKTHKARVAVATEEAPSDGDPVYVRLSANGNLDKLGAFRASWNSGCVPLKGARWIRTGDVAEVAGLETP